MCRIAAKAVSAALAGPDGARVVRIRLRVGCALLVAGLLPDAAFAADESVSVVFRNKPPYSYVENGVQKGFLLARAQQLFAAAGLRARFEEMPPARMWAELRANAAPLCSFGWYRLPEREAFARFSLPIHTDRPQVVLTRADMAPRLRRHTSFAALLQAGDQRFGVVDAVSYGPELDRLIAGARVPVSRVLDAPVRAIWMLAAGRFDFMIVDQDDLDFYLANTPDLKNQKLERVDFPDMPPGMTRHILCSRQVPEAWMQRLDDAIRKQVETPRKR